MNGEHEIKLNENTLIICICCDVMCAAWLALRNERSSLFSHAPPSPGPTTTK